MNSVVPADFPSVAVALVDGTVHPFGSVTLWEVDDRIVQIGLTGEYRGALHEAVRLGMSLDAAVDALGATEVESSGDFQSVTLSGCCLEAESSEGNSANERVVAIYVYE